MPTEPLRDAGLAVSVSGDNTTFTDAGSVVAALTMAADKLPDHPGARVFDISTAGSGDAAFSSSGFSDPALFDAIYEGRTSGMQASAYGDYLVAFVSSFTGDGGPDECQGVISAASVGSLAVAGASDALAQMFGGLLAAHQNGASSLGDAFGQGAAAAGGAMGGMAVRETQAQADAQAFYDRYGCATATARRFFANLDGFILGR